MSNGDFVPRTPKIEAYPTSEPRSEPLMAEERQYDLYSCPKQDKNRYVYESRRGRYPEEEIKERSSQSFNRIKTESGKEDRLRMNGYEKDRSSSYDKEVRYRSGIDKPNDLYQSNKEIYDGADRHLSYEYLEKNKSDRNVDRYGSERDRVLLSRPRSSDGRISSEEKDSKYATLPLPRDMERARKSILKDRVRSESSRGRALVDSYTPTVQAGGDTGREYKALTSTYSELLRMTQQASIADKRGM